MLMVIKALDLAAEAHRGQERKGTGLPYIVHPITVSYLLLKYKISKKIEDLMCATILHDTIEDTGITFLDIATQFSPLTATLVQELTSDLEEIKLIGKLEYLKKKMVSMSSYGLVLKLLDRLANVMDMPTEKTRKDTIELLNCIVDNRKLSGTHYRIINDIMDLIKI